jgi:hypothetical protein
MNGEGNLKQPNGENESRFLNLAVSLEASERLPSKRWQAVVRVVLPDNFRRQDELRQGVIEALAGRSPFVDIDSQAITLCYLVETAADSDQDHALKFAQSIARFIGTDERSIAVAAVDYIDTADLDPFLTLPELQPERYDDIKHL